MSLNEKIIEQILERDYIFGKLCLEAENSFNHKNYFSALACLFVLTEQIIKFSVDKIDGNFNGAIIEAKKNNLIDDTEFQLLNSLREIRNKIFHENHYPIGLEIEGKFWSFSEDETRELIYKKFSMKLFQLTLRIIKG
jgi:hypothetical protein